MSAEPGHRLVLIKLTPESATDARRAEIAAAARAIFPSLPGVVGFETHVAVAEALSAWDLSLTVHFSDLSRVPEYRDHPEHVRFVDSILRPHLDCLKAWNFSPSA